MVFGEIIMCAVLNGAPPVDSCSIAVPAGAVQSAGGGLDAVGVRTAFSRSRALRVDLRYTKVRGVRLPSDPTTAVTPVWATGYGYISPFRLNRECLQGWTRSPRAHRRTPYVGSSTRKQSTGLFSLHFLRSFGKRGFRALRSATWDAVPRPCAGSAP